MNKEQVLGLLHEEAQAQSALSEAVARRAMAAPTPDLRSVWIQAFIRLTDAMIATASAVAALEKAPRQTHPALAALPFHLPKLPRWPDAAEDPPPPSVFTKTTSGRMFNRNKALARPSLRFKAKGGAPRGNRNALKTGCHSAAMRDARRALALYVRVLKAELALMKQVMNVRWPVSRVLSTAEADRWPFLWDAHCCAPLATYPDGDPETDQVPSLFGLAPGGACHAASVAGDAVRSYRTISTLPRL